MADRTAILTLAQRQNSSTYFVGFQIDKLRMRGRELNVELPLQNFREWELARFQPLVTGMDILAKLCIHFCLSCAAFWFGSSFLLVDV